MKFRTNGISYSDEDSSPTQLDLFKFYFHTKAYLAVRITIQAQEF